MQNNGNRFYLYIIYDGHYFCTSFRFDKIKFKLEQLPNEAYRWLWLDIND